MPPASIGELRNLQELVLTNNQLSGELPDVFSGMGSLKVFWAYHNNLTGKVPESLLQLPGLEKLGLFGNYLQESEREWENSPLKRRFVRTVFPQRERE